MNNQIGIIDKIEWDEKDLKDFNTNGYDRGVLISKCGRFILIKEWYSPRHGVFKTIKVERLI